MGMGMGFSMFNISLKNLKIGKIGSFKASEVPNNSMIILRRGEPVIRKVLDKICQCLDCNYEKTVDYNPNNKDKNTGINND